MVAVLISICGLLFVGERYINPLVKQAANKNNTSSPNKTFEHVFWKKVHIWKA